MIIKKNIKTSKQASEIPVLIEEVEEKPKKKEIKSSVLKKQDIIKAAKKRREEEEQKKQLEQIEKLEEKNDIELEIPEKELVQKAQEVQEEIQQSKLDDFEKIDISEIEFTQRVERRRGDRRRGYRRIDERSLVSRAQQEAHSIKELAAREGYENGFSKATKEIQDVKNQLIKFLEMKESIYEKFYPHIVEIALAATEKIIKKEVEVSQDILKNVVTSAMDELNSDVQKVEIKVNSSDVEFAKMSLPEIINTDYNGIKVVVTSDDKVQKGSCIVIANNGVIDANFSTQLAILQNAFGIYKGGI